MLIAGPLVGQKLYIFLRNVIRRDVRTDAKLFHHILERRCSGFIAHFYEIES